MPHDEHAAHSLAAQEFPKSPEARAWEVLQQALTEKSVSNRVTALTAIGTIGPNPEAVKMAENGLTDKEPEVRQGAAMALGDMKARSAIPALRSALDDPTPEVGVAAAEALWRIGDRAVRKVLLDVLNGNRPASEALLNKEMRDARRKLHDPKGLALLGAKEGAGRMLGPMSFVMPLANGVIGEKGVSPRAGTVTLLATDRDPKSIKALEEALADKDWSVRAASAKALGQIGQPQFISVLEPLLLDDKPTVRYAAAASIIRITSKQKKPSRPAQAVMARKEAERSAAH